MRRPLQFILGLSILGAVLITIGWLEARADPIVRWLTLSLPDWPRGEAPVRVALLSDIHIGSTTMDARRLDRVVEQVVALRPDLIIMAGDFVAGHEPGTAEALGANLPRSLRRMQAPLGVVAVLGNHDHWTGAAAVRTYLSRAGVTVLDNRAVRRGPLVIAGIGDLWTGHADLPATQRAIEQVAGARLLVSHSPDVAAALDGSDFSLVLAGHTHCGQIVLPVIGAPKTPSRYGERFRCGVVREGAVRTVVTAGLGTSVLPLRYGAPPDLWLLNLRGSER